MNKKILLSNLIEGTTEAMTVFKLSQKTMQLYHYYGFILFQRYFDASSKPYYSKALANKFVLESRKKYEAKEINGSKFRTIRKAASLLDQYYLNEKIEYKYLPHWKTTSLTPAFQNYLDEYVEEKLSEGYDLTTMRSYKPIIKHFLCYIEKRDYKSLIEINNKDISEYLPEFAKVYTNPIGAISPLRSFGRFALIKGYISINMDQLLRMPTAKKRKYQMGFSSEEITQILSSVDRTSNYGKRDYAILVLARDTGLRSIDILNLKLNSIDWVKKELSIIQHKTDQRLILPLNTEVCNALADYILYTRPSTELDYIFLKFKNPITPLKSWSGCSLVKRNAAKAGIYWDSSENKGMHSFRRSLANRLLESEIPLELISEILGHSSKDSSKPYLATHHSKLLMCALSLENIPLLRGELR